jgi:hypothetical protein
MKSSYIFMLIGLCKYISSILKETVGFLYIGSGVRFEGDTNL